MNLLNLAERGWRFLRRQREIWRRPETRAFWRLKNALGPLPRHQPGRIDIWGWDLEFVDAASCLSAFESIVVQGWYDFVTDNPRPYIIDCGSNVGLSVLHFQRLFPRAEIVAFEPDPVICRTLRRNLEANQASRVQVVEAALWDGGGELAFAPDGADGGRVAGSGREDRDVSVKAVRLRDYLHKPVDLLKMDIEGAETRVLADSATHLDNVRRLVLEYHVLAQGDSTLPQLLTLLAAAGFRCYLHAEGPRIDFRHPPQRTSPWLDQFLMIYAGRQWDIR